MKTIKGELWTVYVCGGVLDMVHGHFIPIKEVYIPKYNISFNIEGSVSAIHVFSPYSGRYKNNKETNHQSSKFEKNIRLPEPFVKSLQSYLELKDKIFHDAVKIFSEKEE